MVRKLCWLVNVSQHRFECRRVCWRTHRRAWNYYTVLSSWKAFRIAIIPLLFFKNLRTWRTFEGKRLFNELQGLLRYRERKKRRNDQRSAEVTLNPNGRRRVVERFRLKSNRNGHAHAQKWTSEERLWPDIFFCVCGRIFFAFVYLDIGGHTSRICGIFTFRNSRVAGDVTSQLEWRQTCSQQICMTKGYLLHP